MILFLGKTEIGCLIVEFESSVVGCEDRFVLIHKPDNITEDSEFLGNYRSLKEAQNVAEKYLEEELPF